MITETAAELHHTQLDAGRHSLTDCLVVSVDLSQCRRVSASTFENLPSTDMTSEHQTRALLVTQTYGSVVHVCVYVLVCSRINVCVLVQQQELED